MKLNLLKLKEKHKHESEDKNRVVRDSLREHENIQMKLQEQQQQTEADNEWLQSEETKSFSATEQSQKDTSTVGFIILSYKSQMI